MRNLKAMTAAAALAVGALGAIGVSDAFAQTGAQSQVVVLDMERFRAQSAAWADASKKLGALIEQQQNNFRTQNAAAMQTMETEGRALAPLLRGKTQQQWAADPVLKAKVEAQMRREQDLQQKEQLLKASAAQTERRVTQELDSKLAPIVDQLMTAHGAAVVLDANAVLKAKTGVDITDEALQKFNATVTTANVAWVAVTLQPAPTNPTTLPKK